MNHNIEAVSYRVVYISLLPALSSPSTFSVPSLPKKGSKLNNSRDAPGVDIVHGRSMTCLLRICHALLEDTVSPGDYESSLYVECALISYCFVFQGTLGLLLKKFISFSSVNVAACFIFGAE